MISLMRQSFLCSAAGKARRACSSSATPPPKPGAVLDKFWRWTTQNRPHWRESKLEAAVIFCVFGATGSSSVYFVRPLLSKVGINGTMMDGPNSYRVLSILLVSPVYACILLTLGTLSGRHTFFAKVHYSTAPTIFLKYLTC
jgi:hypothetical protein